jgi:hypothetical protein
VKIFVKIFGYVRKISYLCSVEIKGIICCSARENLFQCTGKSFTLHSDKKPPKVNTEFFNNMFNVKRLFFYGT